jgi:hypothetical protein
VIKVIVAGSRNFNNYELLKQKLDYFLKNVQSNVEIVSGTAKGADRLGEMYAIQNGYEIKSFPADWDAFGKQAGYIRNKEMAKYATHCVCFWDGKSLGTKSMISLAAEYGLIYRVVYFVKP